VTSASDPAWSPDGSEIAFAVLEASSDCILPARGGRSIYAVKSDGSGDQRLLVRGPAVDHQDEAYAPAWSPDGGYVAFVSDTDFAGVRIAVVTSAGARLRLVTGKGYESYDPDWRLR
jgi:Tol biopolymer transport system component